MPNTSTKCDGGMLAYRMRGSAGVGDAADDGARGVVDDGVGVNDGKKASSCGRGVVMVWAMSHTLLISNFVVTDGTVN